MATNREGRTRVLVSTEGVTWLRRLTGSHLPVADHWSCRAVVSGSYSAYPARPDSVTVKRLNEAGVDKLTPGRPSA